MNDTVHAILQARTLEWVAFPSPGDLPNPGIKSRSPTLQVDSLPAEPQGKPMNSEWVAFPSLADLPNLGMNQGFPHGRQILYYLNYRGSPEWNNVPKKRMEKESVIL